MNNPELKTSVSEEARRDFERYQRMSEHYSSVPKDAWTGAHHAEAGSTRPDEYVLDGSYDKPDLHLVSPEKLIDRLKSQLQIALDLIDAGILPGDNSDVIVRNKFKILEESGKNIAYVTDEVESGRYGVTNEQRDNIYELIALLKNSLYRLNIATPSKYQTKTFEQVEGEQIKTEAA